MPDPQLCPWERIFPVTLGVGDDPKERMTNAQAKALRDLGTMVGLGVLEPPAVIRFRPERTDLSIVLVARGERA